MTDTQVISSSYMSTTPSVQTTTRGTGTDLQLFVETAETLTISTGKQLGMFLDWADLAQSPWSKPAELFDRIGALLNEAIEAGWLGQHGQWTDYGAGDLAGTSTADTTTITVTAANIDDIIRGIKTKIRAANGQARMNQYGVAFVWRAADFELLEAFVQANGFVTADDALKNGTVEGLRYMGCDHYWSNDHTANHVYAGVKKTQRIGILRGTYGRAHTIDFPGSSENNFLSGQAYYSRVDYGFLHPTAYNALSYDVNVA